jgi:phosphoribosyl 1,2-cyclic phosphodiesterase
VKVTIWGTRGSLPAPGPETTRYGGNTSCVEVRGRDGSVVVLDAGTGIRRLGATIGPEVRRVDLLLTHLHLDHIEGLGFFAPLFVRGLEVHIWGPASTTLDLRARLTRYLSPPIFPVRLRDLPCQLELHDVMSVERLEIGELEIHAAQVCHPGPTVGYRIREGGASLAYLPDHEPALGSSPSPGAGVDVGLRARRRRQPAHPRRAVRRGRVRRPRRLGALGAGRSVRVRDRGARRARGSVPLRPQSRRRGAREALRRGAWRSAALRVPSRGGRRDVRAVRARPPRALP